MAAATGSSLLIKNVIPKHLEAITDKLIASGAEVEEFDDSIRVTGGKVIKKINVKAMPHPGFPTDMQAIATSLLCTATGRSLIVETVFENRFLHIPELNRMGANIKVDGRTAIIDGAKLTGAKVKATDLRAGAALVLAGLVAKGKTEVENIEFIERGYENFDEKLRNLGVNIKKSL